MKMGHAGPPLDPRRRPQAGKSGDPPSQNTDRAAPISWDNTKAMWPADEDITWDKFKEKFRRYHIPAGILKIKQHEFLALTQGDLSVIEYLNKFNHLARYSLYDVATEERKIDRFLRGMNQHLRCTLSMLDFLDFDSGKQSSDCRKGAQAGS